MRDEAGDVDAVGLDSANPKNDEIRGCSSVASNESHNKIPSTAVGGSFKSELQTAILNDSDAPRMNLLNKTVLPARRVEFYLSD